MMVMRQAQQLERIIVFAIKDEKIGLAVGVTNKLTNEYDAVKLVKTGSEIIGGKGGGGRPDFAQAGGVEASKIDEAYEKLKSLIQLFSQIIVQ